MKSVNIADRFCYRSGLRTQATQYHFFYVNPRHSKLCEMTRAVKWATVHTKIS